MVRQFLMLALLLTVGPACPHTWGKEGYVQKTFHKNLVKLNAEYQSCTLSEEDWLDLCGDEEDHAGSCPPECPLPSELSE